MNKTQNIFLERPEVGLVRITEPLGLDEKMLLLNEKAVKINKYNGLVVETNAITELYHPGIDPDGERKVTTHLGPLIYSIKHWNVPGLTPILFDLIGCGFSQEKYATHKIQIPGPKQLITIFKHLEDSDKRLAWVNNKRGIRCQAFYTNINVNWEVDWFKYQKEVFDFYKYFLSPHMVEWKSAKEE